MPPPSQPGGQPPGQGDIAVASQDVFSRFVDNMESNISAFNDSTSAARTAPPGTPGRMKESPPLIEQLNQAAQLRADYIEATVVGLQGYQAATAAIGTRHAQLGSVTTSIMQQMMTVHSSKDGGN